MILFPAPFFRRAGGAAGGAAFAQAVFSGSILITNELPVDDTIPQPTEGAEILALTITPRSAASRFLIHVEVFGGAKATTNLNSSDTVIAQANTLAWAAALFRGRTCIQAGCGSDSFDGGTGVCLRMALLDQPATSEPVTWSVRAGPGRYQQMNSPSDAGMALRINGGYAATAGGTFEPFHFNHRVLGGAAKSTLIVQELP